MYRYTINPVYGHSLHYNIWESHTKIISPENWYFLNVILDLKTPSGKFLSTSCTINIATLFFLSSFTFNHFYRRSSLEFINKSKWPRVPRKMYIFIVFEKPSYIYMCTLHYRYMLIIFYCYYT